MDASKISDLTEIFILAEPVATAKLASEYRSLANARFWPKAAVDDKAAGQSALLASRKLPLASRSSID